MVACWRSSRVSASQHSRQPSPRSRKNAIFPSNLLRTFPVLAVLCSSFLIRDIWLESGLFICLYLPLFTPIHSTVLSFVFRLLLNSQVFGRSLSYMTPALCFFPFPAVAAHPDGPRTPKSPLWYRTFWFFGLCRPSTFHVSGHDLDFLSGPRVQGGNPTPLTIFLLDQGYTSHPTLDRPCRFGPYL